MGELVMFSVLLTMHTHVQMLRCMRMLCKAQHSRCDLDVMIDTGARP